MKYFKFLLLFITMGLLQACPTPDDEIIVGQIMLKNNIEESIYFYEDISDHELFSNNISQYRLTKQKILSRETKNIKVYEYYFENNKKLYVFIYKQSTLDNYTWEEIQEQNLYDKRYSFTLDELKAMNWELVYDGN